ncbi:hypothetical protein M2305_003251 [Gluconobacter cerinus]|nr:hypothetical protein [Gluconobacter cerinus]
MKVKIIKRRIKNSVPRKNLYPCKKCGKLIVGKKFCSIECSIKERIYYKDGCIFLKNKKKNQSVWYDGKFYQVKQFLFRLHFSYNFTKSLYLNNTCKNVKCVNPEHASHIQK